MRSSFGFRIAVTVGLICLSGECGCSSSAKQEGKPADGASSMASSSPTQSPKADFPAMPAADFAKEFVADESAAAKKYKDKDVVLTGKVLEKRGDPDKPGGIRIIIAGATGDKPVDIRVELAEIDHDTVQQFPAIKPGDGIKIKANVWHPEIHRESGKPAEIELNSGNILP